jgi:hypothetical protein
MDLDRIRVRQGHVLKQGRTLIFFLSPHHYFYLFSWIEYSPRKRGVFFLSEEENIFLLREGDIFCGEKRVFFSFSWNGKVSVFSPYAQGLWG